MEINAKSLLMAGFCLTLVLWPVLCGAETMWVTDVLRLRLRSEKGSDQNVIGVVISGQAVDVVQIEEEWAQVRLADGRQGWVLKRYLTSRMTNAIRLKNLQEEHDALKGQLTALIDENRHLTKENKRLRLELNQLEISVKKVNSSYDNLKAEAADYLNLKAKYEEVTDRVAKQIQISEELKAEIEKLETRQMIRWFLTGAGVLFFGIIIGYAAKRQRRKSSLRV